MLSLWWAWRERQKGGGKQGRGDVVAVWTPEASGKGNKKEYPIGDPLRVWEEAPGTTLGAGFDCLNLLLQLLIGLPNIFELTFRSKRCDKGSPDPLYAPP